MEKEQYQKVLSDFVESSEEVQITISFCLMNESGEALKQCDDATIKKVFQKAIMHRYELEVEKVDIDRVSSIITAYCK